MLLKLGLCATAVSVGGFALPGAPQIPVTWTAPRHAVTRMDIDMGTIAGVGAALVGVGGGIGLIAFTENAGKRNEAMENAQPCVECKGEQVVQCPVCRGTGQDEFASYVAGVRAEVGEEEESKSNVITIDDWDQGERQVEMFKEILDRYPIKATQNVCVNCDGRGVIVCQNCQGTGLQPRFLERYSPDDFMD